MEEAQHCSCLGRIPSLYGRSGILSVSLVLSLDRLGLPCRVRESTSNNLYRHSCSYFLGADDLATACSLPNLNPQSGTVSAKGNQFKKEKVNVSGGISTYRILRGYQSLGRPVRRADGRWMVRDIYAASSAIALGHALTGILDWERQNQMIVPRQKEPITGA